LVLIRVIAGFIAVVILGTIGYFLGESMTLTDAFLSTVSVMTTVGLPQGLSEQGKILSAVLILASVVLAGLALYKLFEPPIKEEEEMLSGFFEPSSTNDEAVMKEVKVGLGNRLAGLQKAQILQKYGVVVVGIKKKNGFDVNVPLTMRVKKDSSVLLLGTPAAIIGVERKKKVVKKKK
jgi:hypothetical protein